MRRRQPPLSAAQMTQSICRSRGFFFRLFLLRLLFLFDDDVADDDTEKMNQNTIFFVYAVRSFFRWTQTETVSIDTVFRFFFE